MLCSTLFSTYLNLLTTYLILLICLYILSMNQNIFFYLQERNLLLLQNMGRLQRVPELWRKRKFPKTVRTSKRRVVLPNLLTCPPVRFDRFIDQFLKVRNYNNSKYTLLGWKTLMWITNFSREIKNCQLCNYIYLPIIIAI